MDPQRRHCLGAALVAATPRGTVIVSPGRTEPIEKYFEVIAELRQPQPRENGPYPPWLLELARQGRVRLGLPNRPDLYKMLEPIGPPGLAQKLLDEDRGDR